MRIDDPVSQRSWTPRSYDDRRTLGELHACLPGDAATDVPWYVRLLENPKSPVALAGAVDLFTHDCIHLVLGRGLLPQDEAFVLGFTMGTSAWCPGWHARLLGACARYLYRGSYRFSALDQEVFHYAVAAGRTSQVLPLSDIDFASLFDQPLATVRTRIGLRRQWLDEIYEGERRRWPHTAASRRLRIGFEPSPQDAVSCQPRRAAVAASMPADTYGNHPAGWP
ncbi:MAG TPA: hypothetical protein VFU02_08420 [Polyangiaceae bacterium]|nr:hypothetical protein [Polyangiaceae bacterium]